MKCPECLIETEVAHWGGLCADCANEAGREYEQWMDEAYDRWVDDQLTERGK